jgi:hypothetical protein
MKAECLNRILNQTECRSRSFVSILLRGLFCLVVALLLSFSLVRAVDATSQCLWPSEWDLLRDIGMAQTILDGRYPEDPILSGETLWYNPFTGAILALSHQISGISLPRLGILLGPYLNLITPLGFVFLLACLFGRAAALAGLCMVLYGKDPANPFFVQVCYAPWLMAPLYASGLMFFTLAVYYRASKQGSLGYYIFAGCLLGITFMAHTAPAIIVGGTISLHVLAELLRSFYLSKAERKATTKKNTDVKINTLSLLTQFFALLLTAFVISLPFTWNIIWHYGFHVRNVQPALFSVDFVLLENLPERLRETINWRNGFALVGMIELLRRRDRASRLVLCWLLTSCLMLSQHYVWQAILLYHKVELVGFAPGHHWTIHLSAVRAALFAVGVTVTGAFMLNIIGMFEKCVVGRLSGDTSLLLQNIGKAVGACLAGVMLYADHPLLTRTDFQVPQRKAYHEYHERHIPVYEWILANTPPDAVILCFEDEIAMTVVMPAARKLLFPLRIYSNLYVDPGPLSYDRRRLVDAVNEADWPDFCAECSIYPSVYMLLKEGGYDKEGKSSTCFFDEVYRAGDLVVFKAKPCE